MNHFPDTEDQLNDVFAIARDVHPNETEVQTVMRRLRADEKPARRRRRLFTLAPAFAVVLIATVLAVDVFKGGDGPGGNSLLVENARAAVAPTGNSILLQRVELFTGASLNEKGEKPKVILKPKRAFFAEQWQQGTPSKGQTHDVVYDSDHKPMLESVIKDGKSTFYSPVNRTQTSFKGVDLWSLGKDRSEEKRLNNESEIFDKLSTNPTDFYRDALNGKNKVKVLGKTKIRNRDAFEILIPSPKERGVKLRTVVAIDNKTYKPIEMRVDYAMDVSGLSVTAEIRIVFTHFERIAVSPLTTKSLAFTPPTNVKPVAPHAMKTHVNKVVTELVEKLYEKEMQKAKSSK